MPNLDIKWGSEEKPFDPITDDMLTCRTCKHKDPRHYITVSCEIFITKPVPVLKGGACSEYQKE